MTATVAAPPLTVMIVNIHKGFTTFNRKFILPELRDAVRRVGTTLVAPVGSRSAGRGDPPLEKAQT